MRNQPLGLSPRNHLSSRGRRQGRLGTAAVMIGVVLLLSGCMEALQAPTTAGRQPPAALPSPQRTVVAATPVTGGPVSALPGSFAPDPATAAPTTAAPTLAPTTPAIPPASATALATFPALSLATPEPVSNEARWRAQQNDRRPFEAPRAYFTPGSELWWYDPVNQQSVILGRITGDFLGQAEFVLRGQGVTALEVPYQVNQSYGLTALSPVLVDRIRAAGYTEWIETYVFLTPDVFPR